MTGTDSSRARALSPREISLTSWTRFESRFVRGRLHQLEVVDDHEVQAGLRLEAARLRPQLHRRDVRRVVDVERRLGQVVHRRRDPGEVQLLEEARAEALRVDVGDAGQQAQHELLLAHLEAEHADRLLLADRGVLGDVEREARLADGRAGRDDDQVALLEAGRQLVQVQEARRDAAQLAAVGVEVVEPVVGGVEELLELAEAGGDPPVRDREQLRLGAVDRLLDLGRVLVADAGDLAGGADQVPEDRLALDDPRVLDGVDGGRRLVRELREVGPAADLLEVLARSSDSATVTRSTGSRRSNSSSIAGRCCRAPGGRSPPAQEFRDLDDRLAIDQDRAETDCSASRLCGGRRSITWPRWRQVVTTDCHGRGLAGSRFSTTCRPIDSDRGSTAQPVDRCGRRRARASDPAAPIGRRRCRLHASASCSSIRLLRALPTARRRRVATGALRRASSRRSDSAWSRDHRRGVTPRLGAHSRPSHRWQGSRSASARDGPDLCVHRPRGALRRRPRSIARPIDDRERTSTGPASRVLARENRSCCTSARTPTTRAPDAPGPPFAEGEPAACPPGTARL